MKNYLTNNYFLYTANLSVWSSTKITTITTTTTKNRRKVTEFLRPNNSTLTVISIETFNFNFCLFIFEYQKKILRYQHPFIYLINRLFIYGYHRVFFWKPLLTYRKKEQTCCSFFFASLLQFTITKKKKKKIFKKISILSNISHLAGKKISPKNLQR